MAVVIGDCYLSWTTPFLALLTYLLTVSWVSDLPRRDGRVGDHERLMY